MRNDFCSNYLEHSAKGSTWKKKGAKYISRVWKNGKWVYEYKITGKGYLKEKQAIDHKISKTAEIGNKAYKRGNKRTYDEATKLLNRLITASESREDSYNEESLAGVINSGKETIKAFFDSLKPQTTVTVETYGSGNLRSVNKRDLTKSKKK